MKKKVAAALGAFAILVGGAASAAPDRPPASTGTSCAWPARLDPTVANSLYPDSSANYWITDLPAVPGATLTITGQFPYGRYMSFTSYTPYLFSVDGIHDRQIAPDPGSRNPYLPGADRRVAARNYSVTVVFGPRPASPPPNTLYTTSADGSRTGDTFELAYRVYLPDKGKDDKGGVPLPGITINLPGAPSVAIPPCRGPGVPSNGLNDAVAEAGFPWPPGPPWPGTDPPVWHRFYNGLTSAATLTDNGLTGKQVSEGMSGQIMEHSSKGGFLDNPDNAYVYAMLSRGYGPVAVLHGRLPTFADTYPHARTMPAGTQLRYWSMCSYEIATERYYGCVADDQVATDANGDFTIVISNPVDRPTNARDACGVSWLPAGPAPESLAIMRNMLPDPAFTNAIQFAGYGSEERDMGAYYPAGHYTTKAAFEAAGCHGR
jgi:hypothetical protein